MNINWFKDPDHLVYINAEKSLAELEKRLKLPGLVQAADMLRAAPNAEAQSAPAASCLYRILCLSSI